jgi:hypothetical protein
VHSIAYNQYDNLNESNRNLNQTQDDCFLEMKNLKLKNPRKIALGHLNINSIRNKFMPIKEDINNNLDLLVFF